MTVACLRCPLTKCILPEGRPGLSACEHSDRHPFSPNLVEFFSVKISVSSVPLWFIYESLPVSPWFSPVLCGLPFLCVLIVLCALLPFSVSSRSLCVLPPASVTSLPPPLPPPRLLQKQQKSSPCIPLCVLYLCGLFIRTFSVSPWFRSILRVLPLLRALFRPSVSSALPAAPLLRIVSPKNALCVSLFDLRASVVCL